MLAFWIPDSQMLTSTADGSSRDGIFREEVVPSPDLGVQRCISDTDVEADGSRLAFDFPPTAEAPATLKGNVVIPEGNAVVVGSRGRPGRGHMARIRRARRKLKEMQRRHDILVRNITGSQ